MDKRQAETYTQLGCIPLLEHVATVMNRLWARPFQNIYFAPVLSFPIIPISVSSDLKARLEMFFIQIDDFLLLCIKLARFEEYNGMRFISQNENHS